MQLKTLKEAREKESINDRAPIQMTVDFSLVILKARIKYDSISQVPKEKNYKLNPIASETWERKRKKISNEGKLKEFVSTYLPTLKEDLNEVHQT